MEISPGISLEGMMLKLKLQYFGHLMWRVDSGKDSDAGRDWRQEEKGTTKDEMAGWHHWLDGCESEWTPGVGDGQGGLACCVSWGHKESDTTEQLNWTELNWGLGVLCQSRVLDPGPNPKTQGWSLAGELWFYKSFVMSLKGVKINIQKQEIKMNPRQMVNIKSEK